MSSTLSPAAPAPCAASLCKRSRESRARRCIFEPSCALSGSAWRCSSASRRSPATLGARRRPLAGASWWSLAWTSVEGGGVAIPVSAMDGDVVAPVLGHAVVAADIAEGAFAARAPSARLPSLPCASGCSLTWASPMGGGSIISGLVSCGDAVSPAAWPASATAGVSEWAVVVRTSLATASWSSLDLASAALLLRAACWGPMALGRGRLQPTSPEGMCGRVVGSGTSSGARGPAAHRSRAAR